MQSKNAKSKHNSASILIRLWKMIPHTTKRHVERQMFFFCLIFWDDDACSPVPEDLTCDLVWPHRLRVSGTKRHTVEKTGPYCWNLKAQLHHVFKSKNIQSTCKKRGGYAVQIFRLWWRTESSKQIIFAPDCVVSVIIKPWGVVDGYFLLQYVSPQRL